MNKKLKRFILTSSAGFIAILLLFYFSRIGFLEPFQNNILDLLQSITENKSSQEIVIVGIDDTAFKFVKEVQPIPRDYIAGLIETAALSRAKVIGIDVDFREKTNIKNDNLLVNAVKKARKMGVEVVSASILGDKEGEIYNISFPFHTEISNDSGFINVPLDEDGVIRKMPLIAHVNYKNSTAFSFAVHVLKKIDIPTPALDIINASSKGKNLNENINNLSEYSSTLNSEWMIYFLKKNAFLTVPSQILYNIHASKIPPPSDNPLKNKIVLIGATFSKSRDFFNTPRGYMSGVEIHANIIYNLLTQTYIKPLNFRLLLALQAAVCLLSSLSFTLLKGKKVIALNLLFILSVLFPITGWLLLKYQIWVDFFSPAVVVMLSWYFNAVLEKKRIRASFNEYVSKEVAEKIYLDDRTFSGEKRVVTAFFTDIRDFTTISETLPPEKVAKLLNEYFEIAAAVIAKNNGIINDFIGDAIFAIFGAPVDDKKHPENAVKSAIELTEEVIKLNQKLKEKGFPEIRIGIGIHTGEVFAGNIGAKNRKKYTIIGDSVNIASRVEGLNKAFGTKILITGETFNFVKEEFDFIPLGESEVKGKKEKIKIYSIKL